MVISMLNQLGDYCTYLANKSATGTLTQEESANLQTLHNLIVELQQSLTASGVNMAEGAPIAKDLTKGITLLFEVSRHFSSDKVSYPELIYDGPFSSVKATGEASLLADKAEIDEEAGKKKIAELFKDATDIQKTGETSGAMPCHIYEFKQNGELGYAEITKAGGVLKEYNCYRSVVDPKITTDECKGLAEEYAEQCGFNNLSVVWVSNKNSTVYVNMAYTQNDTIYYNDLIQLKIASDDGKLVGINATNYIVNHKQREPKEIIYTKTQASQKITDKLEVETIRLAVIPYKNTERITYEFFGSYNNDYYFVYVCAEQNCELEVKRVSEQDGAFIIS